MPLRDGSVFAGYTVLGLLGSGGMGEVYLVQHPRMPRREALKILPASVSADREFRARFDREADLASALYHQHIVGVHDRGECDGQLWISMDYVDGLDAARLLTSRYPEGMPPDHVVRIVTAVAGALDYAHKQALLHRDVKPANIMLTQPDDDGQQRILLTDFGIARSVDDISGLTATNMTVGTVAYSAPEQLLGEEVDGRADQYALAATAYHLLTGSQLFPHSNPVAVIGRHLNTPPPTLASIRPDVRALDEVLSVALAKNPDDRFPRCSDFARALTKHATNRPSVSARAPTSPAPAPRKPPAAPAPTTQRGVEAPRKSVAPGPPSIATGASERGRPRLPARRRWGLASAALVGVVVLVGIVALAWRPWQQEPSTPSASSSSPPTPSVLGNLLGPITVASPDPVLAALLDDFAQFEPTLHAKAGIAVGAVGSTNPPISLGDWQSGPAWSTMDVPLTIAALRQDDSHTVTDVMRATIVESDDAAAESLWATLGDRVDAATKVADVLRHTDDQETIVPSQRRRVAMTIFGQTDWSLTHQVQFISSAACDNANAPILTLMGQIEPSQSWGLGTIPGAQFKGGWGPSETGNYMVRQFGVITTPNGKIAVALAAEPESGQLNDGTADLSEMAKWLIDHLGTLPTGQCGF
jgi:serine/threonine protein kinase